LDKKYRIIHARSGKGVFSNVVKAIHIGTNEQVAIKLLRSEEIYTRSGERER
jgi:serine/threonine protein kinase